MSCPTCDHTMEGINSTVFENATIFHCPRCGTTKNRDGSCTVPKLVDRIRELESGYVRPDEYPPLTSDWRRLGIAESINLPANRPN